MNNVKKLVKNQLISLLSEEQEILVSTLQEINSCNGNFENLQFYNNDEDFFDTYFNNNPYEAVRATFYGDYRFNDDYVYFNAYGNLDSFNYIDEFITDSDIIDIVDDIMDNVNNYSLDENIEIYLELLEYEKEYNIFSNVINELKVNDKNGFYEELLKDCDYNIIYAINELKDNLNELINNEEYKESKEFYSNLLKRLENIEE